MNPVDEAGLLTMTVVFALTLGGWVAVAVISWRRDRLEQRDARRRELHELEVGGLKELHQLLNFIHADDDYYAQDPRFGSYTREHGLRQSIRYAMQVVAMLREEWATKMLAQMKSCDRERERLKPPKGK